MRAIVLAFLAVTACISDGPPPTERELEQQRAFIGALSDGASSAGTLGTVRSSPTDNYEQQSTCGNGDCTPRVDSWGRDYCTCKGRQGRAKLYCCGL